MTSEYGLDTKSLNKVLAKKVNVDYGVVHTFALLPIFSKETAVLRLSLAPMASPVGSIVQDRSSCRQVYSAL